MLIPFKDIVRKYGKPKGILHIGANIGEEAKAYYEAGVEKVAWFEGNPDLYATLSANISKYPGQTAYNNCIGDYDGDAVLHIANNGGQSSSVLELGTHKTAHPGVHYVKDIPVKMNRIDTLCPWGLLGDLKGIDFLNCDLQGFELQAIKGMGDLLKNFKYAYLEINKQELYKGCALWPEVEAYMKGFGFVTKEIKMSGNSGWGDCLMVKR
jgi:FkbM family methyltransferase